MPTSHSIFSFAGRINRATYIFITIATYVFVTLTVLSQHLIDKLPPTPALLCNTVLVLMNVLVAWVYMTSWVKRWHDIEKSGFWCFSSLVPVLGWIYCIYNNYFTAGTDGTNRFGEDPNQIIESDIKPTV